MNKPATLLMTEEIRTTFGKRLQVNASLSGYTTARVGGPADALITANSRAELEQTSRLLWERDIPFTLLGYGSNVLICDEGVRGVILLNRARAIKIDEGKLDEGRLPSTWAESGALIGTIARRAAQKGLSGFEWAATVPGTLGGAVYGNAGAHGSDMNGCLLLAEILHPTGIETWTVEQMQYAYRSSLLKREKRQAVILSAQLKLQQSDPASVQEQMDKFAAQRRATQPPGASLGSMFRNPPGDYAGRLIQEAGLKGAIIGDAEISAIHANFFINHGKASAADIGRLIQLARETVAQRFGVQLELEVELLGDWSSILKETSEQGSLAEE